VVEGKVNWSNVAHIGIIGLDSIMLSIRKGRHTNIGMKENKTVSVNIVNEDMVVEADYVGLVSGKTVDKSKVFEYHMGELKNVPIIDKSPLAMECELVDIYDTKDYDNFILKVVHTHVEEEALDEKGKIDYEKVRPLLFEMPTTSYLKTGDVVAKCWNIGREYKNS
jgi:flavin reductase (DIM6/NTAB) family NADH-FMN oxidoreductase RutF